MMNEPLPHIGISYNERVPEALIAALKNAVAHDRLDLRIESRPGRGILRSTGIDSCRLRYGRCLRGFASPS